jgi:hypothetical protein
MGESNGEAGAGAPEVGRRARASEEDRDVVEEASARFFRVEGERGQIFPEILRERRREFVFFASPKLLLRAKPLPERFRRFAAERLTEVSAQTIGPRGGIVLQLEAPGTGVGVFSS